MVLASRDLDQNHRVKAKPLRGRFASLASASPTKGDSYDACPCQGLKPRERLVGLDLHPGDGRARS